MPKEKCAKLIKTNKQFLSDIVNKKPYTPITIANIWNKNFSIFNKNKSEKTKIIQILKYNLNNESCFFYKNLKRNFSILEKIKEHDKISKEEFVHFIAHFQSGEINLSDFPQKYRKFLKEIKLLPGEPEEPDDCCGKDCVPCTIVFYHEKLDRRDELIANLFGKIYPDYNKEESSDVVKNNV